MISMKLKHGGEQEKLILSALRTRLRQSAKTHSTRVTQWRKNEELFVAHIPEKDADAIRRNRRDTGTPEYTTLQIPYSYAVAMAAHAYWTTVFLSRSPVFQFMGNTDEGEDQVLAIEALHNYQVTRGRMLANLYVMFQDVPKYGEAWVSPYWRVDRQRVSQIVEEEETYLGLIKTGKMVKRRITQEIIGYEGNALFNLHPSKVFTDPRYPRNRFQDGEFIMVETELSRNQLVIGKEQGQYINIEKIPQITRDDEQVTEVTEELSGAPILERPDTGDFTSFLDPKASDVFKVYEAVVDIIPSAWKLGSSNFPEKWVFTVDKGFTTVVECRPLGNIHNKFPLAMIEIEPEGYSLYSRSLMEIYSPVQNTIDWLINSHFFNVRQVLNNQWLLDPSRIQERDLAQQTPGMAIRLKPAAYGSDVRTALMQLPVSDVTQNHLRDMSMMYDLGERLGVSDQMQGVATPSSRRTAQEIRGDQTFGVSRLKTMAEYFSATGISDLARMMSMNSQQYYSGEKKLRIAGEAGRIAGAPFVNVTPEMIAGDYSFEPVDGTLPVDRFAQVSMWRELIVQMAQVPQVIAQYDLGRIFGFVAQLGGIKNLNRFKIQLMPDEAMQMAAQAGNTVPAVPGNPLEPGQTSGMGPTA